MKSKCSNTTECFSEIVQYLRDHHRLVLTSHSRPDGDSIGSQLALGRGLEQIGKTVEIINSDPVPAVYRFLPGASRISVSGSFGSGNWDSLILLECNDFARPGLENLQFRHSINIDHHADGAAYADLNWIDPTAAAVAEMVYELLLALDVPILPEIATNLYTGILTDTGSFQFACTTARTFEICSSLLRHGADPAHVSREVYQSQPVAKVRLLARVLSTLQLDCEGRLAWISMPGELLEQVGADTSDTEGIVNHVLSISGVRVAAFFREGDSEGIRVSLRSRNGLDVSRVARGFGGGGHTMASGLTVRLPLEQAIEVVLQELRTLLEEQ